MQYSVEEAKAKYVKIGCQFILPICKLFRIIGFTCVLHVTPGS